MILARKKGRQTEQHSQARCYVIAVQSTSSMRSIYNLCDLCRAITYATFYQKKITYATYSLRFLYLNLFFYLVTVVMYGQRLSSEGPYLLYNI
jgi:hypothetical protein